MENELPKLTSSAILVGLKSGVFAALTLVAGIMTVFTFAGALRGEPGYFTISLLLLVLFLALFSLQTVLLPRKSAAYVFILLQAFGLIAVLIPLIAVGTMSILLLGAAACFVFLASAHHEGRTSLENCLRISLRTSLKPVYHHATTGIVVFLSAVSYLVLFVWGGGFSILAERLVSGVVSQSEYALKAYFPGASFTMSADDFLQNVVRSQLRNQNSVVGTQLQLGSDSAATDRIVISAAQGLKGTLEKALGPIDGKKSMKDVLVGVLTSFAESVPDQFRVPIYIFVVFMIFWLLKSTVSFLSFVGLFLAWLMLKMLLLTGFARIEKRVAEQETVAL